MCISKTPPWRNGRVSYRLIGEGDLPIEEMMQALSSVNYDGFISLEWDPSLDA